MIPKIHIMIRIADHRPFAEGSGPALKAKFASLNLFKNGLEKAAAQAVTKAFLQQCLVTVTAFDLFSGLPSAVAVVRMLLTDDETISQMFLMRPGSKVRAFQRSFNFTKVEILYSLMTDLKSTLKFVLFTNTLKQRHHPLTTVYPQGQGQGHMSPSGLAATGGSLKSEAVRV